jgi:hypothetical protein
MNRHFLYHIKNQKEKNEMKTKIRYGKEKSLKEHFKDCKTKFEFY